MCTPAGGGMFIAAGLLIANSGLNIAGGRGKTPRRSSASTRSLLVKSLSTLRGNNKIALVFSSENPPWNDNTEWNSGETCSTAGLEGTEGTGETEGTGAPPTVDATVA